MPCAYPDRQISALLKINGIKVADRHYRPSSTHQNRQGIRISRHNGVKCLPCYILAASIVPLHFARILDCRGAWRAPFVR
jgi:hypothetical protein